MTKNIYSKGFSVVAVLLVLVVAGSIVGTGWYVYSQRGNDNRLALDEASQSKDNKTPGAKEEQETITGNDNSKADEAESDFLVINEWGVKIKMRDAEKTSYTFRNEKGYSYHTETDYDSFITPVMKPDFLQDKSCEVGIGMLRSAEKPSYVSYGIKPVNGYYFWVEGGPGACSNDPENNPDDILKSRVLEDFSGENVFAL